MKNVKPVLFFVLLFLSGNILADSVESKLIFDSPTNRVVRSGWINVDSSHYLQGKKLSPEYLNSRIVVVHRWCAVCPKIEGAIKEFANLKSPTDDIVFMTSYFPDTPHTRDDVVKSLKDNKVKSSVYIGSAVAGQKITSLHRVTYVVLPGGEIAWSKNHNTCIGELKNEMFKQIPEWRVKVINGLVDSRPGLALMRLKELKTLHPKAGPITKEIQDRLDKQEVRVLADFEKTLAALSLNSSSGKIKGVRSRIEKFGDTCPEEYQGEVKMMLNELSLYE